MESLKLPSPKPRTLRNTPLCWLPDSSVMASRRTPVVVLQAAQHGVRDDRASSQGSGRGPCRDELADSLVRPALIEVANVLHENLEQVTLAEDEHVIEALAAYAAQKALAEGVGLRRAYRCFQDPRSHTSGDAIELAAVLV